MSALTISLANGQSQGKELSLYTKSSKIESFLFIVEVESCISYNASGHPLLNILWNDVCLYIS